jgi:hypothetical protein
MIEQLHMKCAGNWVSNLKVPGVYLSLIFFYMQLVFLYFLTSYSSYSSTKVQVRRSI